MLGTRGSVTPVKYRPDIDGLRAVAARLAREVWHVEYISMNKGLCAPQGPVLAAPDVPVLFDTDHLTLAGSVMFAKAMRADRQLP